METIIEKPSKGRKWYVKKRKQQKMRETPELKAKGKENVAKPKKENGAIAFLFDSSALSRQSDEHT